MWDINASADLLSIPSLLMRSSSKSVIRTSPSMLCLTNVLPSNPRLLTHFSTSDTLHGSAGTWSWVLAWTLAIEISKCFLSASAESPSSSKFSSFSSNRACASNWVRDGIYSNHSFIPIHRFLPSRKKLLHGQGQSLARSLTHHCNQRIQCRRVVIA